MSKIADVLTGGSKWAVEMGDCLESLRVMPAGSVHTCVTSPPYYGLRNYGHAGQIGLEATPAEYVARLVAVFEEVRRVLRDDGTLWLNLGDSYANTGGHSSLGKTSQRKGRASVAEQHKVKGFAGGDGIKIKDLLGIPWRVAFALQAAGWYLRQDIIWAKPNPMPESVRDRCTKSHEYVFLLSKNARYFFDAEAIAEKSVTNDPRRPYTSNGAKELDGRPEWKSGQPRDGDDFTTRNRRSVWTVTPDPYPGAHFAVMPPDLVRPCVLAGCPAGGVVLDPFAGSGTTLAVAVEENRRAVGCELNGEYIALTHKRLRRVTPTFVP